MLKTLIATFGHRVTKLKRSYYWPHVNSDLLATAEKMREELNANGYDLDLASTMIRITRRRSVFGYTDNGQLSHNIFKERRSVEQYLEETELGTHREFVLIEELPVR